MENYELGSLKEHTDINKGLSTSILREIASCCLLGLECLHSQYNMHTVVDNQSDKGIEHQTVESAHWRRWSGKTE